MAKVVVVSLDAPYCQLEVANAESLLDLSQKVEKKFSIKLSLYDLKGSENSAANDASFTQIRSRDKVIDIRGTIRRTPTRCARCNKEVSSVIEYQRHWNRGCGESEAKVLLQPVDSAVSAVFLAL
jgi:hypothetical protein